MPQPIGKYSVNQSGRAMKITVPAQFVEKWELENKDEIFIYAEKMDGKLVMVVSKEALQDDLLGD